MARDELIADYQAGRISRRTFTKKLMALGVAFTAASSYGTALAAPGSSPGGGNEYPGGGGEYPSGETPGSAPPGGGHGRGPSNPSGNPPGSSPKGGGHGRGGKKGG